LGTNTSCERAPPDPFEDEDDDEDENDRAYRPFIAPKD
jgi:hypothetical protein